MAKTSFHIAAEQRGIPVRTLLQVRAALAQCRNDTARAAFARLLLRHARLSSDAMLYLCDNFPIISE